MRLSQFGQKLSHVSGINELMLDLGAALSGDQDMLMLGGGNPAYIPKAQQRFRQAMTTLMEQEGRFEQAIGTYDPPQGNRAFIAALADLLSREYGLPITSENIALTNGSQCAFFTLFNMFAGPCGPGEAVARRNILLPLAPEYIGYADVWMQEDFFISQKPDITFLNDRQFKYHINFDAVSVTEDVGAICVSRPTNPTGNVLTDDEIARLSRLARDHDIPLIIDNAYGTPFPHIIFTEARPFWDDHIILCMSLSKLGLPALRTGIVIARPDIIAAVCEMNAILSLAPGGMGAALATEMVRSGAILDLSRRVIQPHYQAKSQRAVARLTGLLDGLDCYIHKPEGALFLWLWMRDLPITSHALYERLKRRGVLVVSGHYFFPGLSEPWRHTQECLRITYSMADAVVDRGLEIIADEVRRAYNEAG